MKQETNKEMELMLRRLARRGGLHVPDNNGNVISEQHLDADEMNAYAEHALPAAARARYTEHLADCVRCREIVVGLSASLGRPVVEKVKTPEQRSSARDFLATLFSPMFARFAIPTLALVGIVGIAVIVFRQGPSSRNIAQTGGPAEQVAQATPATTDQSGNLVYDSGNTQTKTVKNDSSQEAKTVDSLNKDAPTTKASDQPVTVAPEAPPPPVAAPKPAKLAAEEESARREADVDQKRPVTVERQEQPADEVTRGRDKETAKKDADDRTNARPAKSAPTRAEDVNKNEVTRSKAAPASGAGATVGQFSVEEKRKEAKEVRTVAGRRFEREGNAWVDTAYVSGRDTTNLSRSSEQYRALIADEPEIRTIAETLSGEVVVIWKGRAYRIR